ncbi:12453_t:CDS:2 [Cetraspora pellucida]|uniref:12453_t:CDS:1 n=1 Tax=Cetraspora pellucida TaxID=1433469 RepID=A0A9N9G5T9_9GLOM|nr:12453_t:CDS:2 [Cetraspora pellucida]
MSKLNIPKELKPAKTDEPKTIFYYLKAAESTNEQTERRLTEKKPAKKDVTNTSEYY